MISLSERLQYFSLLIAVGAVLGLWRILKVYADRQPVQRLLGALCVLLGSWLGGWVAYILNHGTYFSINRSATFRFWEGGVNGVGALCGGLLTALLIAILSGKKIMPFLDQNTHLLFPMAIFSWLASWAVGMAYGNQLSAGTWWGMMVIDEGGTVSLRVPLQIIAALTLFLLLLAIETYLSKNPTGSRFMNVMPWYVIHQAVFFSLRTDPAQRVLGLRQDAFLSWILALSFLVIWLFFRWFGSRALKRDTISSDNVEAEK